MKAHNLIVPHSAGKILPKGIHCSGPSEDKSIYLTFDDGPVEAVTLKILDLLEARQAKATFFCVGENITRNPFLYNEILNRGHLTGNHTHNHLNGWKTQTKTYLSNIEECEKLVGHGIFRPPYGRIGWNQWREVRKKFNVVFWSILSGDFDRRMSPRDCAGHVIRHVKPGSIVVFHDSLKASANVLESLPAVLDFLSEKNYKCNTLHSLLKTPHSSYDK